MTSLLSCPMASSVSTLSPQRSSPFQVDGWIRKLWRERMSSEKVGLWHRTGSVSAENSILASAPAYTFTELEQGKKMRPTWEVLPSHRYGSRAFIPHPTCGYRTYLWLVEPGKPHHFLLGHINNVTLPSLFFPVKVVLVNAAFLSHKRRGRARRGLSKYSDLAHEKFGVIFQTTPQSPGVLASAGILGSDRSAREGLA
jgi:hypothetical protein